MAAVDPTDLPHVVHVIDELPPDGAERLIVDVLQNRSPRFRYSVLCIVRGGTIVPELERIGVPVAILGRRPGVDPGTVGALMRWFRSNQVDIVHTHLYAADTYGRLAALLAGVRGRFSTRHNTSPWSGHARRLLARLLNATSTKVIACGGEVGRTLLEREGLSAQRMLVISNGINLRRFDHLQRAPFRRELGVSEETTLIGVVGRLHEQKGHSDLFKALAAVPADCGDYLCAIVGSGPLEAPLREQCRTLGLDSKVRFVGQRSDIPNILAALDLFAMPSRWEGLPMALLEAMAVGAPVLATAVGEIPGVIADGVNGRLVSPGNVTQFTVALIELLRNPALRRQLGKAAQQTVVERFSAEQTARAYERLYDQALTPAHG
ncbi:MAG TPA: glycosyltransferase [Steroidobacteraceae bacterium]|nr:glycosyltransferase [Steroidobacteraceae bacterium]